MRRRGFTLIEMIVVIVIIVLAMTLAIPAIRSLTGSRSQEAAQNVITTALGTARSRAMALQHVAGILFYIDSGSDRVMCQLVEEMPHEATDNQSVTYLDAVDDTDPIALPAGLRLFTMKDKISPEFAVSFTPYFVGRYMGYNYPGHDAPVADDPTVVNTLGGVILFDSMGRLTFRDYGFRFMYPARDASHPARISAMGSIVYRERVALPPDWPTSAKPPFLFPAAGFVIVDRETFVNQTGAAGNYVDWNQPSTQLEADNWLDTNTTPIFVNRYDATLIMSQ